MDEAKRQSLESFLLLTLHAAGEVGLQAMSLLPRARLECARELTVPDLDSTLRSLADRSLVIEYPAALGAKRWKLTGLGGAALREMGLV